MGIVVWQMAVAISIMVARAFSYRAMIVAALCWTAFTFLIVWAFALVLLQLVTAWGTVWLLSKLFGRRDSEEQAVRRPVRSGASHAETRAVSRDRLVFADEPSADQMLGPPRTIERLVAELLASGELLDDTRDDLLRFLAEARAGHLEPDDLAYVTALHARTVSDRPGPSWRSTLLASTLVNRPRLSPNLTVLTAKPLTRLAEFAKSAGQAIDRLDDYVTSQRDKQKANSDLNTQLFGLRLSLESAMEAGAFHLEVAKSAAKSPRFGEIFRERQELFPGSDEKRSLKGVTLSPVDRDRLPEIAVLERLEWLRGALEGLDQARVRINRDAELLAAVNSELSIPFERFIAEQSGLLRLHVAALSTGSSTVDLPKSATVAAPTTKSSPASRLGKVVDAAAAGVDMLDTYVQRTKSRHEHEHNAEETYRQQRLILDASGANESNERKLPARSFDDHVRAGRFNEIGPGLEILFSDTPTSLPPINADPKPVSVVHDPANEVDRAAAAASPVGGFTVAAAQSIRTRDLDLARSATVERLVQELRVPHLVHFTRCENLPGIVQHGLMSVAASERNGVSAILNDATRWDGQLDGTSLSIAFPNYLMFYKYRQITPGSDWAVLLISPRVLWEKDCGFYCFNAADSRMIRRTRDEMKSAPALSAMFEGDRDSCLKPFDPTDPQAEVMVYETIEPALIEAIAFETSDIRNTHLRYLNGIESFYAGPRRGLFATRRQTRLN